MAFRNGDAFYPGRKFVINQRQSSTFDSFLNTVTRGITAHFGAVRNIYTPNKGHRVVDLEQLVNGEIYVAARAERLKKMMPNLIISYSAFTNGDILVPPAMVLIPKHTLASWENVLAMVTERVHLRCGAVHRLCMLNGRPVRGLYELQNNHYYVAVGKERFRSLPCHLAPSKKVIHNITDVNFMNCYNKLIYLFFSVWICFEELFIPVMAKPNFEQPLLKSSLSHDPSGILIC
uniref:Si:dkey-25g12.4 n=1 Tax=Sinocyclocheilus anshuiensis TaxID=1608454 RepID=A0A671MRT2_9TELE